MEVIVLKPVVYHSFCKLNPLQPFLERLNLQKLWYTTGVLELKVDFGPGYRVYFGKIGSKCILLLCGGDKGSQKNDIQNAKIYFSNYQARGGADE